MSWPLTILPVTDVPRPSDCPGQLVSRRIRQLVNGDQLGLIVRVDASLSLVLWSASPPYLSWHAHGSLTNLGPMTAHGGPPE